MTTTPIDRALLLARTVRHLQPSQLPHRLRLRSQLAVLGRLPESVSSRLWHEEPNVDGWPPGFEALDARSVAAFPNPGDNSRGSFSFLNDVRDLGQPLRWTAPGASRLWRYHLHYFEWAWSFAAVADREWARHAFTQLWTSWRRDCRVGRGDPWSPYVASLRAWALCGVHAALVEGTEIDSEFTTALALHAGFVRAHLEFDVGGNHLIKNLKALVGLGVFLGDRPLVALGNRHLERQLTRQVLADGGHYERSPSYHCQVLGDLIDIRDLLIAANLPMAHGLDEAIVAMRRWLGSVLMPDGDVPLFNDCVLVGSNRIARLEPEAAGPRRLTVLQPSGYVVVRPDERVHLVADVGPPCPRELPAHAHADCLSFELAVDGHRVIVDSGTSTYAPGQRRAHERSTAAHNTVEVDGENQTEVWGTFRAARRALPSLEQAVEGREAIEVVASHDGYQRLPGRPRHRRSWRLTSGCLEIVDEVLGEGHHRLVMRLHVAPGLGVKVLSEGRFEVGPVTLELEAADTALQEGVDLATGFGQMCQGTRLTGGREGRLPQTLGTRIVVHAPRRSAV